MTDYQMTEKHPIEIENGIKDTFLTLDVKKQIIDEMLVLYVDRSELNAKGTKELECFIEETKNKL